MKPVPIAHNVGYTNWLTFDFKRVAFLSESYEIVFPEIIEEESGILVNDVSNFVKRRKRGSGYLRKPLEVSISGSGEQFKLELWENNDLVAPGFKIYHRKTLKDSSSEHSGDHKVIENEVHGCHFTGSVKSHGNTPASISICHGMVSHVVINLVY